MKTATTIAISVMVLMLIAAGALARDNPEARTDRPRMHTPQRRTMLLERFDRDGDGKLSKEERAAAKEAWEARQTEIIRKFDKDGDGKLSEQERAAAKKAAKTPRAEIGRRFGQTREHEATKAQGERARKARRDDERPRKMHKRSDEDRGWGPRMGDDRRPRKARRDD
ncbi:MAG: EF-hand domain-containing protein, partial [Phycisphaerae bacterium]|nr:EF-hand domain-containing protein [Phycisphaerae bacterium]